VPRFIEFPTETEGVTILVEVDAAEAVPPPGVQKAGLFGKDKSVAVAGERFDVAIRRVISENVRALTDAVKDLAEKPDEVELKFGLKATGELGNIAIAKVGVESTFEVRLAWKQTPAATPQG
jgi:Trypsin-co-occurring domain 1